MVASTRTEQSINEFGHAVRYVAMVKNRFIQNPIVFESFLSTLQSYQRDQSVDMSHAVEHAKAVVLELFSGHDDLIEGFYYFLPKEKWPIETSLYRTTNNSAFSCVNPGKKFDPHDEFMRIVLFLQKVKKRFEKTPKILRQLDIVFRLFHRQPNQSNASVHAFLEIVYLFQGHTDLIMELREYLSEPAKLQLESMQQRMAQSSLHGEFASSLPLEDIRNAVQQRFIGQTSVIQAIEDHLALLSSNVPVSSFNEALKDLSFLLKDHRDILLHIQNIPSSYKEELQ